jgi:GNAT superfamily N-acetyltransferase
MREPKLQVATAAFSVDPEICQIARQSRYTRDFASHMFFRDGIEQTYAKGEVGAALLGRKLVGFVYCKHVRRGGLRSVIHYMGVDKTHSGKGIGRALLEWAKKEATTHGGVLELSCETSNEGAEKFYRACGFNEVARGTYGTKNPRPYVRFAWAPPF